MRIRIKDETINLNNVRIESKCAQYADKIREQELELAKLEKELESEIGTKMPPRNFKPMFAQMFLGKAFHKMKEEVEFKEQTAKAYKSVHNINMYQFKTQAKQTR